MGFQKQTKLNSSVPLLFSTIRESEHMFRENVMLACQGSGSCEPRDINFPAGARHGSQLFAKQFFRESVTKACLHQTP